MSYRDLYITWGRAPEWNEDVEDGRVREVYLNVQKEGNWNEVSIDKGVVGLIEIFKPQNIKKLYIFTRAYDLRRITTSVKREVLTIVIKEAYHKIAKQEEESKK